MKKWSINNIALADLGIDNLVLHFQNQDDDYAELSFALAIGANLPAGFAMGDSIVVRYGHHVAFRGKIGNPVSNASANSETVTLYAFGPWHDLARIPLINWYDYNSISAQTTHSIIQGTAESVLDIAFGMSAVAAVTSKGIVDLGGLFFPETEIYDTSCADIFRQVLRFIPGAVVCFDYATDPPTCHVLRADSDHLQPVSVSPAEATSARLEPRHDLVLDGVRIFYERQEVIKSRTWYTSVHKHTVDDTVVDADGYQLISHDDAGDVSSFDKNVLLKTITLQGRRDVVNAEFRINLGLKYSDIFYAPTPPANWVWLDEFMKRNVDGHVVMNRSQPPITHNKTRDAWHVGAYPFGWTFPPNADTAKNWFALDKIVDGSAPNLSGYDILPCRHFPEEFLWSLSNPDGLLLISIEITWEWSHPLSGGPYTSTGRQYFVYYPDGATWDVITGNCQIVTGDYEEPPTGLATEILSANQTLFHDGSMALDINDDPLKFAARRRLLTMSAPAISTPIQRLSINAATGLANVAVGAPSHLGPQDVLALRRARLT